MVQAFLPEASIHQTKNTVSNATGSFTSSVFSGQNITFTLYRNTTSIGSTNPISDVTQLSADIYNYTYFTAGNQNYSSATKQFNLTISKGTLSLTVTGINVTYPTSVVITPSESNTGDKDVNY